uniref:Uncharacterized protein n=1 Tax=Arsenophonus endosymbiont of Trialeurodes vaporariorum TaxID=235567 RepID=A0A3B0MMH9_9GAMM
MKIQSMTNSPEGYFCAQSEDCNIFNLRKAVISGNWSVINNGICTLTDLGLRHNGNGLVWLNSGISVHEADSDIDLTGQDKQSYDYEDHIHFLTKKRQRIAGKQLTGYTAKGVEMREVS